MIERRTAEITHSHELPAKGDALDWALAIYEALTEEQQERVRVHLRIREHRAALDGSTKREGP